MLTVRVGEHSDNRVSPEHLDQLLDIVGNAVERKQELLFIGQEEGQFFCSGFDLRRLSELSDEEVGEVFQGFLRLTRLVFHAPVRIMTQANGHAVGVGAMLCLAADYTSLYEQAKWRLPEGALGLGLFDDVVDLIRYRTTPVVAQRLLCGALAVPAAQALKLGLVDGVHHTKAGGLSETDSVASYAEMKRLSRTGFLQQDTVAAQVDAFMALWCSAETKERIRLFLKR